MIFVNVIRIQYVREAVLYVQWSLKNSKLILPQNEKKRIFEISVLVVPQYQLKEEYFFLGHRYYYVLIMRN